MSRRFFASSVSSMLRSLYAIGSGTSWMPVIHDETSCTLCLGACPKGMQAW